MIFNSSGEGSSTPPSRSSPRRKDALFNSKAKTKKAKHFRRKRMVIRKTKSIAKERTFSEQTGSSDCDDCSKKKRRGISENETESTEEETIDGVLENDVGSSRRDVTCRSHGKVSLIGRRREMEDAVAVELGFLNRGRKGYDFFGVYDGHGGRRVAQECSEMLHKLLVMILGEETGEEINWGKLMAEGFKKMDEEVNKYGAVVATIGSTAVVSVVGEEVVVVANCGDSRAVLSRGGTALPLSDDHKPDRPDELERIEISGGKVINWNGQRVLGVLATSRSIGDHYLKPFVITEPEVKVINRTDKDEFLILASDGLWDVVSNDLACQVTRRCLDGRFEKSSKTSKAKEDSERDHQLDETKNESLASRAAAVLAELAMARGSGDNISVIVVKLERGRSSSFSSNQR